MRCYTKSLKKFNHYLKNNAGYNDFRELLTPGLSNAGTYMTYKYVTVKLNSDGTLKLRLYCSTTQSGKLIPEHKEQEGKPNWYMLLAEANVYNIGNTTI